MAHWPIGSSRPRVPIGLERVNANEFEASSSRTQVSLRARARPISLRSMYSVRARLCTHMPILARLCVCVCARAGHTSKQAPIGIIHVFIVVIIVAATALCEINMSARTMSLLFWPLLARNEYIARVNE